MSRPGNLEHWHRLKLVISSTLHRGRSEHQRSYSGKRRWLLHWPRRLNRRIRHCPASVGSHRRFNRGTNNHCIVLSICMVAPLLIRVTATPPLLRVFWSLASTEIFYPRSQETKLVSGDHRRSTSYIFSKSRPYSDSHYSSLA